MANIDSINVQGLVNKARAGSLSANHPDFQTLERMSRQGVQAATNALDRIDRAGGARSDTSVNKIA